MRIKFTQGVAGARFAYRTGEKADLREDLAREFLRQGVAVPDRDEPAEAAVVAAPENASRRARRRNLRNLGGLLPQ